MSTWPDMMFQALADTRLRLAARGPICWEQTNKEKTLKIQMQGV